MSEVKPTDYKAQLPSDPKGFTKRCEFHMSYEHKKKRCGKAVYRICDPNGEPTPVYQRYDTNPENPVSEYAVEGWDTGFKKWSEAAAKWNEMLAAREATP